MISDLYDRFQRLWAPDGSLPVDGSLLVGVSGGADSVALLHLLCRLRDRHPLTLVVAHLDHGLRQASAADADFVRALAEDYQIRFVGQRVELATQLVSGAGGPEEIARRARRDFLERTAQAHHCDWIILGHHRDDQAETVLLRLLRGAGTRGLSGMRMFDAPYVRPLLEFSKEELRAYLKFHGHGWREDASNQDRAFTRNRIRHELLPMLGSFNPRITEHLARLAGQFAEEDECWRQFAEQSLSDCLESQSPDGLVLSRRKMLTLPSPLVQHLVRSATKRVRGDLRGISAAHIDMLMGLVRTGPPQGEIHLPGMWVGRRYDTLLLQTVPPSVPPCEPIEIDGPGDYPLSDGRTLHVDRLPGPGPTNRSSVEFSAGQVGFPLLVRCFEPGDRFAPEGMSGSRKLQDLYVDLKLTREQRRSQPLVFHGKRLLWVVGLRRCAGSLPTEDDPAGVLRLRVEPA